MTAEMQVMRRRFRDDEGDRWRLRRRIGNVTTADARTLESRESRASLCSAECTVKENFLPCPWATTGSGRWGIRWDYSHWPPFQVHLCVPPSTPDYKASAMANPRHSTG